VLNYLQFDYQMQEWDNMPQVVPRFFFYLQAYL